MNIPAPPLGKVGARVFNFIVEQKENGRPPPTRQEIADRFLFKSPNSATEHLATLERKGYIKIWPRISRGIEILDRSYKDADSNAGS